jgi:hypothetical protein
MIVAQFHEYGAAHRAFCELIQFGIVPCDISIIAGDRSNQHGAARDFGILRALADDYVAPVRRGLTLLAVRPEAMERARVAAIINRHAPFEVEQLDVDRATVYGLGSPSGAGR